MALAPTVLTLLVIVLPAISGSDICFAQSHTAAPKSQTDLEKAYDTAQAAQASGDLPGAAASYKTFITAALSRMANAHQAAGDNTSARKLREQALGVAPSADVDPLRLSFARAALDGGDFGQAASLAQQAVDANTKDPVARLVLGQALLRQDRDVDAHQQLEAAVALDADYANGLALATADLALADMEAAAKLFREMLAGFGDHAALHFDFGRAYAEAGYPEQAVVEFKQAMARDPKLLEVHYCLGASYILQLGEAGFSQAAKEFHAELQLRPDDYFSLSQLGYIALTEGRNSEAESNLKRAAALDPRNPDNYLLLGQLYLKMDQTAAAEQSFRKAIALTTDLARNHYQVQRAHYLLGRLLIRAGNTEEGKQEMLMAADLLRQNQLRDQKRLARNPPPETTGAAPESGTHAPVVTPSFGGRPDAAPMNAEAQHQAEAFEARMAPVLADCYNNLGAIAAGNGEFATATGYFKSAARWKPSLDGLDYNWGRAAFSARMYAEALPPIRRYLEAHPDDPAVRSMLGICYFMLKDYGAAVRTLQPIRATLSSTPQLAGIYAESLARSEKQEPGTQPRTESRTQPGTQP